MSYVHTKIRNWFCVQNKTFFIFSFLSVFVGSLKLQTANAETLSLSQTIDIGLKRDEQVRASEANVSKSKADTNVAGSRALPQIDLNAGVKATPSFVKGSDTEYSRAASLQLRQSLLNPILPTGESRSADFNLKIALLQTKLAKQQQALVIIDEYTAVLSQENLCEQTQGNIRFLQKNLGEIKQEVAIGKSAPTDLPISQAKLDVALASLAGCKSEADTLRAKLFSRIGREFEFEKPKLDINDATALTASIAEGAATKTLAAQLVQIKSESATSASDIANRDLTKPSLDFIYNLYPYRNGIVEDKNWDASLQLSFNLYAGGRDYAQVEKSIAHNQLVAIQGEQTLREAQLQIEQAKARILSGTQQLELLKKAQKANEQALKITQEYFRTKRLTIREMLEAEETFFDSKSKLGELEIIIFAAYSKLKTLLDANL